MVENEFGDEFIYWESHVGDDDYEIPETVARANWYGVGAIPEVRIDGKSSIIGASNCSGSYSTYRSYVVQHLAENGGMSPVEITGNYLINGNELLANATFALLDDVNLYNLRATILLYEDNVDGAWPHVVRAMYDQNISLPNQYDTADVSTSFDLNPGWVLEELTVVAYVQTTTGNKEIYQGFEVPNLPDFTLDFDHLVRSVPNGEGTAVFDALLTNVGDATDTITLQPGNAFGDWPSDFLVCGDTNPHTDPVILVLDPGEECAIQIRVYTDDVKEARPGGFQAHSQFSDRTQTTTMQVYNGSYSLFFVDDDRYYGDELPITNALDELGYLYVNWDVYNDHNNVAPRFSDLSGYDYVVWHNSWWPQPPSPLTDSDVANLMAYMDGGGSLFYTSQLFLNTPVGPPEFITDYLGVASYTLDPIYEQVYGVAGDPIGDNLDLPLDFPFGSLARGDRVVAGPTATVCMTDDTEAGIAVRNEMGGGAKSVFMAVALNAVNEADPDPNNLKTVLERILAWLAPNTVDVDEPASAILASRIDGVRPNPFNPRTEIAFALSSVGAAGPVQLDIYDLEGRKVANLFEGHLNPGPHTRTWNGLTDDGKPVHSGVYFSYLTTQEGTVSEKLVLLK